MLNVGLLGAGRIAGVHASAISSQPGSTRVAVSDIKVAAAQKAGRPIWSDTDAILNDPATHAALIATRSDLIKRDAGKTVLCEKPVDLSLALALACQKTVAVHGQPIMIGFNRRFDQNFAALKAVLDAGEIGRPELLSIASFDPHPATDGLSQGLGSPGPGPDDP